MFNKSLIKSVSRCVDPSLFMLSERVSGVNAVQNLIVVSCVDIAIEQGHSEVFYCDHKLTVS